jgi:SAM-dependent methyltransferase
MTAIPLPPPELQSLIGPGQFEVVGYRLCELLRNVTDLNQASRVLDIGCGCGRLAVHLTRHISEEGRYDGLDIVLPMVEWCRENISPSFPHFHFHHARLTNTLYSAEGENPATFTFPFADASFDIIVATSVFTHLLPPSAHRYASEVARLLKPRGTAVLTFFLINSEYRRYRRESRDIIPFDHRLGDCWVTDPNNPEAVVAYEDGYAIEMLRDKNFTVDSVLFGDWARRNNPRHYQDVVVASRSK